VKSINRKTKYYAFYPTKQEAYRIIDSWEDVKVLDYKDMHTKTVRECESNNSTVIDSSRDSILSSAALSNPGLRL
jgi:hypothetical protein